jgi:hypothetical protein
MNLKFKRRCSVEVDVTETVADYEVRIHLAHDQVQQWSSVNVL